MTIYQLSRQVRDGFLFFFILIQSFVKKNVVTKPTAIFVFALITKFNQTCFSVNDVYEDFTTLQEIPLSSKRR